MMKSKLLLLLVITLGSLETLSLSRQLVKLLGAGNRITQAEERVAQAQQKNEQLKKQLDYYRSQEFLEKEARDKLNLAYPDETVAVIPQELLDLYLQKDSGGEPIKDRTPNWRQWQKAFFD